MHLELPEGGKNVLLHCCCAPCSGAVVECLVENGIRPVLFFSNSNIVPREEYDLRRGELERYARLFGLECVDDEYDHEAWLDFVLHDPALVEAPERGPRCLECFKFRLKRAARYAATGGFDVLSTTLASSRWKSLEQVDEAGRWACGGIPDQVGDDGEWTMGDGNQVRDDGEQTRDDNKVVWWPVNWRKGGLQPRRSEIIREQGFYNQNYCGCEFSEHHDGGQPNRTESSSCHRPESSTSCIAPDRTEPPTIE